MSPEEVLKKNNRLENQLRILSHANRELNTELSLTAIRRTLVQYGQQLVAARAGAAGLLENQKMVFREYFDGQEKIEMDYVFESGHGVPGWVADHLEPYITHDAAHDPQVVPEIQQALDFTSLVNVPIIDHESKLIGCLEMHDKAEGEEFSSQDIEMLQGLAAGAAIAMRNALALERQRAIQKELTITKERYRNLVEYTSDWVWEVDQTGCYTYASPKLEAILGYQPTEVIGRTPFDLMPAGEAERVKQIFFTQIAEGELPIHRLINTNLHKNGRKVVLETSAIPVYDDAGKLKAYRGIDRDVTETFKQEQKENLASMVLDNTPEGVMIVDSHLRVISVNPAFTFTTGYSFKEMQGKKPSLLSSGKHDKSFYQQMWQRIDEMGYWQGEIWNRRKNGEIYPEWMNINSIKNDAGDVLYYAAIFSDISSQEQIRQRLHTLAYYDDLTGLPNRELFNDHLDNALAQAHRHNKKLAVMFLDVDRFKNVNDTLGHKVGDLLLQAVAENIRQCVRDSDSVSRFGGDEFTIILNDISRPEDAVKVVRKIVDVLSRPIKLSDGMELYATTSMGICIFPEDGNNSELLIKNADTAMYRAKEAGRNNYQFYTSDMSQDFAERLMLENDLRKAVEKNELSVAYQPQVNLITGEIIGFEALVRWQHDTHGWVSPMKFIPIAEDAGMIYQIGEWVLKQACQQIKIWREKFGLNLRMAINISGHQLSRPKVVDYIVNTIDCLQLPHEAIELELTESSLMDNIDSVISVMDALNKTGIQLAIDDFGTGYSSLSYIKRFSIDKLKIDKSFIQDISSENNEAEIVTAIIAMANNLGIEVIAEGVEKKEEIDFLYRHGCNEIQGYYFSEPKFPDEIDKMLLEGKRLDV
ncbi:MAG: EAL domain-containing protein [Gammaproteobacteria bacterium]|nr:EAL domain-containing protein [Gammaproteobacteria bacterium]